jgi:hypothetical protein
LKNDASQIEAADQQTQDAIGTFVQQLDSIGWPTSTRQYAGQLAQSLTDDRNAVGQEATDLLNGLSITQDNQNISSVIADIRTEFINLSTALGIPPPSAPATT